MRVQDFIKMPKAITKAGKWKTGKTGKEGRMNSGSFALSARRPARGRNAVKAALCKAFCDDLTVREVPAGLAVSTSFGLADGDKIGFYVITDRATGTVSLQDSGLILPALEASGLDRKNKARAEALVELQSEYGVDLDEDDREFRIVGISEQALPGVALRFVAFLLRVHDLLLLVEERVANTFRDDVRAKLEEIIGSRAPLRDRIQHRL